MNNNIDELRKNIDNIDSQIIKLFEERMEISLEIAQYKKENNLHIFNKAREDEVIKNNIDKLKNKELTEYTENLLRFLMIESKKYQYKITNANLNG